MLLVIYVSPSHFSSLVFLTLDLSYNRQYSVRES